VLSLFNTYPTLKERIPHVSLGEYHTPIQKMEFLGHVLGLEHLYVKRDDLTGKPYGGNKIRKLEFLLADVKARKAKEVITFGCVGSNHALATSIYAKKLSLKTILILLPQPKAEYVRKNLLMELAQGAELHYCDTIEEASHEIRNQLMVHEGDAGKKPVVIPAGGSSHLGAIGFVNAAFELKEQIDAGIIPEPDLIYVALGTMSTATGLIIGLEAAGLKTKVVPVRVTDERFATRGGMIKLFYETNTYLHAMDKNVPSLDISSKDNPIRDEFFGEEYALFTKEGVEAVKLMWDREKIPLEGTYTGKALACLIADTKKQDMKGKVILFWNTYNSQDFQESIDGLDYHELPAEFYPYFKEGVQPLDSFRYAHDT